METPPPAGDPTPSRPFGGTELSWLRAVPGGTGITVLSVLLSRPLPLPLLRSSLLRLLLSHPILRSLLPPPSSSSSSLLLLPPSPHLSLIPSHPQFSLLHSIVEHEMSLNPWSQPDPLPPIFASLYRLPDSPRSVLALRLHTAVCDRVSGLAILNHLMELMVEEEGPVHEEGEVGLPIEDLIRKEDAWKPFWARGKDLIGYSINGVRSGGLGFEDVGSARRSELVRLVVGAAETRRLRNVCDANGVKLCAALTAAGFLATYASKNLQNNQPETYTVITLVDCRQYLDPPLNDKHIGFYHSGILNTHTIHGEGFWEVAIRCHKAYSNAKKNKKHLSDIGELNFLMCKAIENPHLTPASSLRTALISVFEEPVDHAPMEQLQALGVEDILGCASVHGVGASIALFDTIRNGQLDCACVYPAPLHSRKQMEELVENMKRILMESCCVVDEGVS